MTDGGPPAGLASALALLQTQLPVVKKRETAVVETQRGSYSYAYADLADVSAELLPLLGRLGLSFSCRPTLNANGDFVLAYTLRHVSGEQDVGEYPLPKTGTPQAVGGAITYGRRYCLCAITGLVTENDDDAAMAQAEATANRGSAQRAARPNRRQPSVGTVGTAQRAQQPLAEPPLPGEESEDQQLMKLRTMVSPEQLAKLRTMFSTGGISDKQTRLDAVRLIVGREDLTSSRDLTRAEASRLIEQLDSLPSEDASLAEVVGEMLGRRDDEQTDGVGQ